MKVVFLFPAALWLLPLALLPFLPRRRPALAVSSLAPLAAAAASWRVRLHRLQPWLAAAALLTALFALAEPVRQETTVERVREGVELMLALDISASMRAADIPPDRMRVAREAAADFLRRRTDDRVGVVLFSGVPYLLAPPTGDPAPVVARLLEAEADRPGTGTAVGDALAAAAARLKESTARSRAVVLLTDGASNRGRLSPLAAARAAAALGIRVYTIGFGSEAGGEVPAAAGGAPLRLPDGTPLRAELDEATLREVARLTGGQYFRAGSGAHLAEVYRRIDALEKSPLEIRERVTRTSLLPPLLATTAILTALDLLLFRAWLRRVP
jgi:Ca-activated chloride channel family protein